MIIRRIYVSQINIEQLLLFLLVPTGLKVVLGQYELFTDRNTKHYSAWTTRNGDPMHEVCVPHRIPRAWEQ